MRRRVFFLLSSINFSINISTVHLKGNADPDGPDANVNTNANATMMANANAYTDRGANHSGTVRDGRHRPISTARDGLIISCCRDRSGATDSDISALSHCRAAKSNAQANDNHCSQKLLHKVCLLY